MLVGIKPREGLQYRGRHLEHQCYHANLGERESEFILNDRVDRGDYRLNHVVQEVGYAANDEHRIHRALHHRGVAFQLVAYRFDIHCLLLVIFRAKVQNILQILDESPEDLP